ncbi:MAG: linear amide C-N hydrolase [Bacteroidales bacterium]|nr:linear amide C-N hydrolase [Bacteroidales bacterium]
MAANAQNSNPACALKKAQAEMLSSLKNVDKGLLYELDYQYDYDLDRLIENDVTSVPSFVKYAVTKMMNPFKAVFHIKSLLPACSAFQAVTPDGDIIYARNFDFTFSEPSASVLVRTQPENGYASISMAPFSLVGKKQGDLDDEKSDNSLLIVAPYLLMDGINEKGLAVSVLYLDGEGTEQYDPDKHDIMTLSAMRIMLDKAADTDEALALMQQYNMFADKTKSEIPHSYHFLISDAKGHSVVLEYIHNEGDKSWTMSPVEAKYVTNAYLNEGWQHIGHGSDRYEKVRDVYEAKNGVFTEEEAMQLLKEVSQTATAEKTSNTQWSAVYNLTKKTVKICMARDYDKVLEFEIIKRQY